VAGDLDLNVAENRGIVTCERISTRAEA
jgi:hypothetical protein